MAGPISTYLRNNVLGLVALFVALSGSAYAAGLASDSVKTKHIKDGHVRTQDLAVDAVNSEKVAADSLTGADIDEATLAQAAQPSSLPPSGPAGGDLIGNYPNPNVNAGLVQKRISSNCAAGESIRSIAQDGTVTCETDDAGGSPSGSAGGDLTGSYPNPTIAANAIGSGKVADNSLTDADINQSTFSTTPSGGAGGDLTGTYPNPTIAPDAVNSAKVAPDTLTGDDIDEASLPDPITVIGSFTVNPESWSTGLTFCPAGFHAVGGGVDPFNVLFMAVTASSPYLSNRPILLADGQYGKASGWFGAVRNYEAATRGFKIAVVCSPIG